MRNPVILIEEENLGSVLIASLKDISAHTRSIDLRIHKRYDENDLDAINEEITRYLSDANIQYHKIWDPQPAEQIQNLDAQLEALCSQINYNLSKKKKDINGNDIETLERQFEKLLELCNSLVYSFQTVRNEIKPSRGANFDPEVGMILLCKNVRIMEDLISKICSNNIEKSIIDGEKHFKSMRLGFEWLFCHNDINESSSDNKLDIRDENRYLDYIKCQLMISSKRIRSLSQSSVEIDSFFDHIKDAFERKKYKTFSKIKKCIDDYKNSVKYLTEEFFETYELLVRYRDALFRDEEIRKYLEKSIILETPALVAPDVRITPEIVDLSSVAVRVLLDRFVSFVKINELNFGNSTFNSSWFNYSELSKSNYAGSNFDHTRIENAKMRDCDISTCNLSFADAGYTDFSNSNFNYSDLTGTNLIGAILNHCDFQNAIFRDANIDQYQYAIETHFWHSYSRSNEDYWRTCCLFEAWKSTVPEENSINTLISSLTEIRHDDLTLDSNQMPWTILQLDISAEKERKIINSIYSILREHLSQHISAELLAWVKKRFSRSESDAIDLQEKYGKVFLESAEMKDISAKYTHMSGCDLCHINMKNATFEDADLSNSHMYYTRAQDTSFIRSNINQVQCFETDFYSANFTRAVANGSLFLNCNLNHTNWNSAILIRSNFIDLSEQLEGMIQQQHTDEFILQLRRYIQTYTQPNSGSVISDYPDYASAEHSIAEYETDKESFWRRNCCLNDATFIDVLADSAAFINITADRSSFNKTSFKNTIFANCKMYLTDFISTDFRYANLVYCCLGQSNFSNANFINSAIRYVDFSNSNLCASMFNLCTMDRVLFLNANLCEANLSAAEIRNCAFVNCKFEGINLSEAKFYNCIFHHIEFKRIIGSLSAAFNNCYVSDCSYEDLLRPAGPMDKGTFFDPKYDGKN